ncbi:FAD-binding oxidoreductase [Streptomyces sp. ODS28]|uniref:FAD-binding oxidoreductase n=1 Tax=Streptomyces sp. ODS28 TaxID=3136688 RepID=UPI0031E7C13C
MTHTHSSTGATTQDTGARRWGRRTMLRAGAGLALGAGVGGTGWAAVAGSSASDTAWDALAKGLDGTVVRPGDAHYGAAHKLFNPRFDGVRPAGVAYCAGSQDVKECLAFARRHGIPVAIRSGGHSYAGWSTGQGMVIDVQKMAWVKQNGKQGASIGAGAKLIDVYDGLARHGRTIPAGSCPSVGVSGLTLGGGVGVVARAYGLTSDSLTGARIVTADGRIRDVDASHDPDLFWALRGAGNANFGVVTGLEFRTHPAHDGVTFFLSWPWSRAAAVLREWQRWAPDAADEIWANLHLSAPAGGRPGKVMLGGFSLGTRGDVTNQLDRLADRVGAPASSVSIKNHTFMDAMKIMGGVSGWSIHQAHLPGSLPGNSAKGKLARESYAARSDFYTRSIPADGIKALLHRVEKLAQLSGGGSGSVAIDALGGAANRVGPQSTAFVHRNARFLAQYIISWPDSASQTTVSRHRAWLDATYDAMRPWASGQAYQNYSDPKLKDWRRAYYGANASRLAKVKSAYDPKRLFRHPQSL